MTYGCVCPHPLPPPHSRGRCPQPGWSSPGNPSGLPLTAASPVASGNLPEPWPSRALWRTLWKKPQHHLKLINQNEWLCVHPNPKSRPSAVSSVCHSAVKHETPTRSTHPKPSWEQRRIQRWPGWQSRPTATRSPSHHSSKKKHRARWRPC